jgi:DNA-binding transcriptional ArsR family regulator
VTVHLLIPLPGGLTLKILSYLAFYLDGAHDMRIDSRMANLDVIFHGLADPTRRMVIARLAAGPASVSELAAPHEMALPSFLKHLKVLEASGWVISDKSGRVRTCRLRPETVKVAEDWLSQQRSIWEARLDRLDAFLLTMNEEGNQSDV